MNVDMPDISHCSALWRHQPSLVGRNDPLFRHLRGEGGFQVAQQACIWAKHIRRHSRRLPQDTDTDEYLSIWISWVPISGYLSRSGCAWVEPTVTSLEKSVRALSWFWPPATRTWRYGGIVKIQLAYIFIRSPGFPQCTVQRLSERLTPVLCIFLGSVYVADWHYKHRRTKYAMPGSMTLAPGSAFVYCPKTQRSSAALP